MLAPVVKKRAAIRNTILRMPVIPIALFAATPVKPSTPMRISGRATKQIIGTSAQAVA